MALIPVMIMNKGKQTPKRRRPRRRNPKPKASHMLMAAVGGGLASGVKFLAGAFDLGKGAKTAITVGGAAVAGVGLSYLSQPVGYGMIGAAGDEAVTGALSMFGLEASSADEAELSAAYNQHRLEQGGGVEVQMNAVRTQVPAGSRRVHPQFSAVRTRVG